MDKPKVAIDYSKLSPELLDLFDETYPNGVAGHTIRFPNSKGEIVTSVRLETEDRIKTRQLFKSRKNKNPDGMKSEYLLILEKR